MFEQHTPWYINPKLSRLNETVFLHLVLGLTFMYLMIPLDIFEQHTPWYINPNLDLPNYKWSSFCQNMTLTTITVLLPSKVQAWWDSTLPKMNVSSSCWNSITPTNFYFLIYFIRSRYLFSLNLVRMRCKRKTHVLHHPIRNWHISFHLKLNRSYHT